MSPSVLRQSGPPFIPKGATDSIKPRALVSTCEGCGSGYAPFGIMVDGKYLTYCGYQDGAPVCAGKGTK